MKTYQLILAAVSTMGASALAGTEVVPAPAPPPPPAICPWFVGASFGRVYDAGPSFDNDFTFDEDIGDLDFDMYSLQLGRRFDSGFYGFNTALYLEVAYLDGDVDFNDFTGFGILNQLNADIDIVPVTINGMLERNIVGGLGFYLGGGIGYGFTETEVLDESDGDGGFYAQLSGGLNYKFTETFEIFGGARWVFMEELDFGDSDLELDSGVAWEVGLRFGF